MPERIHGYPPVADENSRVLILGSMPSVESLKMGFYYAHPRNAFWRMLSDAFSCPRPETIPEKKHLLLGHRLALWDVIASCEREGSLDSEIRGPELNAFDEFFTAYPGIRAVLVNGGCAFSLFPRRFSKMMRVQKMPSTSPAYTKPYAEKLEAWQNALTDCLKEKMEP